MSKFAHVRTNGTISLANEGAGFEKADFAKVFFRNRGHEIGVRLVRLERVPNLDGRRVVACTVGVERSDLQHRASALLIGHASIDIMLAQFVLRVAIEERQPVRPIVRGEPFSRTRHRARTLVKCQVQVAIVRTNDGK